MDGFSRRAKSRKVNRDHSEGELGGTQPGDTRGPEEGAACCSRCLDLEFRRWSVDSRVIICRAKASAGSGAGVVRLNTGWAIDQSKGILRVRRGRLLAWAVWPSHRRTGGEVAGSGSSGVDVLDLGSRVVAVSQAGWSCLKVVVTGGGVEVGGAPGGEVVGGWGRAGDEVASGRRELGRVGNGTDRVAGVGGVPGGEATGVWY